jgi:hypothetical protein
MKNFTKSKAVKLVTGFVGLAMALSIAAPMIASAAALTSSQVSAIVTLLQSFGADQGTINNVQTSLSGGTVTGSTSSTVTTSSTGYQFNTNLTVGSTGVDVLNLQKVLNMNPATQVATVGAGSPGSETSTFGPATKAAVIKFQTLYGISPVAGYVGAITRAKLNSMAGSTTTGGSTTTTTTTTGGTTTSTTSTTATTNPTGGSLMVSAGVQPANTIAPALAARVPFTSFTVTAGSNPVTINSVTVQRQGPALDTDLAGVVLINSATGIQIGTSRVFDANHSASIGVPVVVPAGTSMTFTVAGNIAAAPSSGDVASVAVTAINTSASVQGSFPIVGAQQTINSTLTIGTASIQSSSFDPNAASSQPIGTTGYRFTGLRVQAGSAEDLTMKSITWYQSGSASGIQNVVTVVNGTSYPTSLDSTGRYYTTVFPSGIVIPKGQQVDVYVQGDLNSNTNANTYAEFDVYRNTDIYLTGNQYGYGITPTISGTASYNTSSTHPTVFLGGTATPWIQGSTVTVTAGQFSTIQNASSVGAQNIAINVPNQVLGAFQTNLTGEGIQVQTLKVHFTTTGANLMPLQNVSLVSETGLTVGGPYNATCDAAVSSGVCTSGAQTVTFTGAINFQTGSHTYTLEGQLQTQSGINGVTIQANTAPNTSDWSSITGATTGNTISIGVGSFTMNTMTIQAASLAVNNGTTPTSQSVVAGGQNIPFATIQLDASQSGEDVRLSSIPMTLTTTNGGVPANLSNCQLYSGSTALNTGSYVVNSANINGSVSPFTATFSFNNSLTIPKGTVLPLSLTCTLSSSAGANQTYAWAPATSLTATGATSGSQITISTVGGNAPVMAVASAASLAVSQDSSSPAYTLTAGGSTGITMNVIKFRASNEPVNLQKVALKLTGGSTGDIAQAYIYAGNGVFSTSGSAVTPGTLIGTVSFSGGAIATSTLAQTVQLPVNTDATLIVKADLSRIGVGQSGVEGDLVKIDTNNVNGVGANSGKTVNNSTATVSSGVAIYATYPTVALGPVAPSNPNGSSQVLKKFSISANSTGPVGLNTLKINIATSSNLLLTNVKLFAYTDAGYSQPANVPGTTGGLFGVSVPTITSGATQTFSQIANGNAPLEISGNGTIYFTLVGDVSYSGTGNNWTVSATLQGDTTRQGGMSNASSTTGGNFVWSPNATTTAGVNDADWTNGYGVPGLPSTGI